MFVPFLFLFQDCPEVDLEELLNDARRVAEAWRSCRNILGISWSKMGMAEETWETMVKLWQSDSKMIVK